MKAGIRSLYFTVCCFWAIGVLFHPQIKAQTPGLDFILDHNQFYDLEGKPYVEIYMLIDGQSLQYIQDANRGFRSLIQLELHLMKGEKVYKEESYTLNSEPLNDTTLSSKASNLLTDLRRFSLEPGIYSLKVSMKDMYAGESLPMIAFREFECRHLESGKAGFSDVEFYVSRSLTKDENIFSKPDGKDYFPLISNSSFIRQDSLNFYIELYNTKEFQEEVVYVSAGIRQVNTEKKLDQFTFTQKRQARAFDVFTGTISISELPSQTYVLTIEIFNSKRELLASTSRKFFVFNDLMNAENISMNIDGYEQMYGYPESELEKFITSLRFISSSTELSFAKVLNTYEEKKNYFYGFWQKRKSDPIKYTEITTWAEYYKLVQYANQKYKSRLRAGWETDRGRILLMYGMPNDIQTFPSMNNMVPYEIWTYNKLGVQPNVIFVFADNDLITNEYPLLHSTKYGEANNPRWRLDLLSRFKDANTVDYDNIDRNRDIRQEFFDITPR